MSTPPGTSTKTGSLVSQKEGEEWYSKLASSYLIFLIVTAIVLAFVTAIFITNTVYYDKINKNKGCSGAVTESEANILFWLNLILAVISGIFFLAAVVLAFIQFEEPKYLDKYIGRISYTPGTVTAAQAGRIVPYARGVQKRAIAPAIARARAGAARARAGAIDFRNLALAGAQDARKRGAAAVRAARYPDIVNDKRTLQNQLQELQASNIRLQEVNENLKGDLNDLRGKHEALKRDAASVVREVGKLYV